MACRDMERGQAAVKEVIEKSNNENVVYMKLDLADSKSIREFAEAINTGSTNLFLGKLHTWSDYEATMFHFLLFCSTGEPKINILINNAGVMVCPYGKTADGFEMQIGVNHMGK